MKAWPGQLWESRSPESQGLCPDEIEDAVDYAFALGNTTGAVLVIKNGYIVREEYSSGRDAENLVTSWSVGKSVTSMMMGIALEQQYLSGLDQSLSDYLTEWRGTPKDQITIDHMMTLKTALETVDAGQLYQAADQLEFSKDRNLIGTPGQELYTYSNADVMLAGEVIAASVGLNINDYFLQNVGAIIGFESEWWVDTENHVLSYCCIDATAREFARFGLLYARDGEWNGTQLVPQDWVERSTKPALEGTYAYYWWPLIEGFGAFGLNSQIVAVYPNDDLVILRFSQYTRAGDGSIVRSGGNYHATSAPLNFDNATFLNTMTSALK
ncbi:MAG: serine hydrolase [Gammaproteobacteria bacterium]|nr:serine hydrolase [Gammaproteobacteria bacterium]